MKGNEQVLYLGDTELTGAARYLSGAMTALRIPHRYIPSDRPPPREFLIRTYRLYILSDYPSRHFSARHIRRLEERVRSGSSLLMIGGWDSFHGTSGRYDRSAIGRMLPVRCAPRDDRRQGAATYRIASARANGWFSEFDFSEAPGICGFNQTTRKRNTQELLSVETIAFQRGSRGYRVRRRDPLLVVGTHGQGTVAALTTDLAPHWAGGLVDWGSRRIRIRTKAGVDVEIGDRYLALIRALMDLLGV